VPVKDFGPSWRDGKAFMATIDTLKPHQIQPQHLNAMSNRERLDMAFKFADRELGIPPLLDPVDVDVQNPDERSIMTYVGQFLHKYPTRKAQQPIIQQQVTADEKLKQIQLWLMEKNGELDQMGGRYPTINQLDLYQSAVHLFQEKFTLYKSQKTTSENSGELIRNIDYLFVEMENHLRNWFSQLLLANLPEEFSEINQWLLQAETIVKDMYVPTAMNEETASIISKKLEDHKKFFASQTTIEQNFNGLQTAYEWNAYQRALIDILTHRMVCVTLSTRKNKLNHILLYLLAHGQRESQATANIFEIFRTQMLFDCLFKFGRIKN
jgi:nesprin-1